MQQVQLTDTKERGTEEYGQDTGSGERPVKSVPAWSCKQQVPRSYMCSVQGVLTHQPAHAQRQACA